MIGLFLILLSQNIAAQDYFIVNNVLYEGNKKTAQRVIDNELDFQSGDTIYLSQLTEVLRKNEKRLLSTGLFVLAKIDVKNWRISENKADIQIALRENWYIYPSFIFELADRNFNVWWTEQKRDFSRVNYGVSLDHINLTGHRDKLKLKFQRGFTHKYEVNYHYPYISKNWGMNGEVFYSTNKEIGYITQGNKTLWQRADDERVLLRRFRTSLGINYRPSVFTFHELRLEYHNNSIDDLVATELNPNYFLDGSRGIQFFLMSYHLMYDRRVFTLYPEGGYAFSFGLKKEGLGAFDDVDNLAATASIEKHHSLNDRWIIGGSLKAKKNVLSNTVSFANNTALGYGDDYIRGYELYVIDGTDWLLAKSAVKWKIYDKLHNISEYMFLPQLKLLPLKLFLRGTLEAGYVNEPTYIETNSLNNRMLYGYGVAFDAILWNTALISLEYSFNHKGESGLYFLSRFSF